MNSLKSFYLVAGLTLSTLLGCSGEYKMVQHERDEAFYTSFQNPGSELAHASAKLESIKLLYTSEDYPIRLAIYDNGQFYYQIDELGTGTGQWVYDKGGLTLTAKRKVFDVNFYVSAANAEGQQLVVKFLDRHGFNQYSLSYRDPQVPNPDGSKPEKLREFKSSIKDI